MTDRIRDYTINKMGIFDHITTKRVYAWIMTFAIIYFACHLLR
jgi:hypothetical protein